MPVWKFRSAEEMPEAWVMNRNIPLGRRIRAVLSLNPIAGPLNMPRGVRRFRSIDEMAAERRVYEQERIARIRQRNAAK